MAWLSLVICCGLLSGSVVQSSSMDMNDAVYQDAMMQELYKRLAHMDGSSAAYFSDDDDAINGFSTGGGQGYLAADGETDAAAPASHAVRSNGQADIRDSEYLEHSSNGVNTGYMYVTGGAGEGKQHLNPEGLFKNAEQIKSDESLPFYCHPPNPCPKGYTSKDGCQEFIDDSADVQQAWIEKMQEKGICSCDEEHMFTCPKDSRSSQSMTGNNDAELDADRQRLDQAIDKILTSADKTNNPFVGGQKRKSLVAKKSPRSKRSSAFDMETELEKLAQHQKRSSNPYLAGAKLRTVAKKGGKPII